MKRYLSIIFLLGVMVSAFSQEMKVKSVVIYKKDKTQEIVPWKSAMGSSKFYGKENPVDGDFVTAFLNVNTPYWLYYSTRLTSAGSKAPYEEYGFMISSQPINYAPDFSKRSTYSSYDLRLYFVDQEQWYRDYNDIYISTSGLGFTMGQNVYGKAYYVLDGKVYYSKETKTRIPKPRNAVIKDYYNYYTSVNDSVLVNAHISGETTEISNQMIAACIPNVLAQYSEDEVLGMATKIEQCDEGNLYIIESPNETLIAKARSLYRPEVRNIMEKYFNYTSSITYQDYSRDKWSDRIVMPRKGSGLSPQTANRNIFLGSEYTTRTYPQEGLTLPWNQYVNMDTSLPSWKTYNQEIRISSAELGHFVVDISNRVTLPTRDIDPSVGAFDESVKEFSYIKGVHTAPSLNTAPFAEIDFKIPDVLSTEYVIYVVTAPSLLDDEEAKADPDKRKGMPLCFNINYCDAEGNIQKDIALHGYSILPGKSTGPARMVATDPEKIDTICLGSVIFPACYRGTDAYANLKISQIRVSSTGSETGTAWNTAWSNTYDKTMRISQIILRPKEYDDYLKMNR